MEFRVKVRVEFRVKVRVVNIRVQVRVMNVRVNIGNRHGYSSRRGVKGGKGG